MTSNAPLPPASGTSTNPITMSDKKGGESSSNSRKGSKKQKKNLGPKLIAIKSLVESQPTTDLQSKLSALAESTLTFLNIEHFKKLSLAKLSSEEDYIPISIRFKTPLKYPKELRACGDTIAEETGWKEDILECQKKLATRIKLQAERNLKSTNETNRLKLIRELIEIGSKMAGYFKVKLSLSHSTVNLDVLAKAALLNLFDSLPWIEKFFDRDFEDNQKKNPIVWTIFDGKKAKAIALVETVCKEKVKEGETEFKWIPLLHSKTKRAEILERLIDARNNNNSQMANPVTPTNGSLPILPLPPPPTGTRFEWDGQCFTPVYVKATTTPYSEWKILDQQAANTIISDMDITTFAEMNRDGQDRKLTDEVMYWMIEVYEPILTAPFIIAKEQSLLDKANAELKGLFISEDTHTLARKIEDKVDADNEHIKLGRSELPSIIRAEVAKELGKNKRKNYSGEEEKTSSRDKDNSNGANSKKNNKSKKHNRVSFAQKETQSSKKKNPYARPTKKITVLPPHKSSGKHQFHRGGKNLHKNQRRTKLKGRGQEQDRNDNRKRNR
jgi:hypothetical protein